MSDPVNDEGGEHSSGLLASSRRLAASLLEMVQTRLEIVSGEFEEERVRLQELVMEGPQTSRQEFDQYIRAEIARWAKVIKDAGIPQQ